MLNPNAAIKSKLVAQSCDFGGYTTYVFQILDQNIIDDEHLEYLMTVRYPNWEHEPVELGRVGYVKCKEVHAGVDEWFDGVETHKYKYDDVIFMKFIPEIDQQKEIIL